jgi:hypothetical protein
MRRRRDEVTYNNAIVLGTTKRPEERFIRARSSNLMGTENTWEKGEGGEEEGGWFHFDELVGWRLC